MFDYWLWKLKSIFHYCDYEMATHSSVLAWKILWTEEHGRLYSPWGHKESDTTEWPNNIRIILEFFEEYKCPGIVFLFLFCQSSRCDSKEEPCLKQLDYMTIFYLYLVCFTFSISYSGLPFHLVCFPIFPSLFFSVFLSQAFFKFSRNVYVYIHTDIYI